MAQATTRPASLDATTYAPTVDEMLRQWLNSLEARNARRDTLRSYKAAVTQFDAFLAERGMPQHVTAISREHVEAFISDLLARRSAMTAKSRFGALRTFWRYVADEEGEVPRSPMERMRAPIVDEVPTPIPDPDALRKLLKVCAGRTFEDRRDAALIRLAADTGLRRGELAALTTEDVDTRLRVVTVKPLTSKSRRMRVVPFGPETANALARYERMRRQHPKVAVAGAAYWVGKFGPVSGDGIRQVLARRCDEAGVEHMHPHQLRHFFAHAMKSRGMSDDQLKTLGGWKSSEMLARYGRANATERALEAYRNLPSPTEGL